MALAFATSYIATTSSQVTRAADVANMTGTNFSSWFNQNQGTFFADYIANQGLPTANAAGILACGPGAYAAPNSAQIFLSGGGTYAYYSPNYYPEINLFANTKPLTAKISLSYSATSGGMVFNGGTIYSQTGNFPNNGGINSIQFGTYSYGSNSNYLNGWFKKFAYYPQVLSSTALQALTGN